MKLPLSPSEFDAKCRELEHECPWLSQTSGARSEAHNAAVNGNPQSKHLARIAMARDYGSDGAHEGLKQAGAVAARLDLWMLVHDKGSGQHLHVQGLPPGPIADWWLDKYGT